MSRNGDQWKIWRELSIKLLVHGRTVEYLFCISENQVPSNFCLTVIAVSPLKYTHEYFSAGQKTRHGPDKENGTDRVKHLGPFLQRKRFSVQICICNNICICIVFANLRVDIMSDGNIFCVLFFIYLTFDHSFTLIYQFFFFTFPLVVTRGHSWSLVITRVPSI